MPKPFCSTVLLASAGSEGRFVFRGENYKSEAEFVKRLEEMLEREGFFARVDIPEPEDLLVHVKRAKSLLDKKSVKPPTDPRLRKIYDKIDQLKVSDLVDGDIRIEVIEYLKYSHANYQLDFLMSFSYDPSTAHVFSYPGQGTHSVLFVFKEWVDDIGRLWTAC